jgi:hypothetical protein
VQRVFRLRFNIQPPKEEEHLSLESPISNFEIYTYEIESIFFNHRVNI